jgi:hypothetical protein
MAKGLVRYQQAPRTPLAYPTSCWPLMISGSVATTHTVPRECKVVVGYTFDPNRFRDMKTPTLLLVGSESPAPQHGIAATVHAAIAQSQVVLLPGEQHWAINTVPDPMAVPHKFQTEPQGNIQAHSLDRTQVCHACLLLIDHARLGSQILVASLKRVY